MKNLKIKIIFSALIIPLFLLMHCSEKKEIKMKKLENLRNVQRWTTHMGAIEGCLKYLGMDISPAWLFGATGHAFVINIHEVICPSGPTAWKTEMLFVLGNNIGYSLDGEFCLKTDKDFKNKQKLAWGKARRAIDQGFPCYGWELELPEYYVITGYDRTGYYYSNLGSDSVKGPLPWKKLADTGIGVLEMYSIRKGTPADDSTTVKKALEFALEHSKGPEKWIFPKYKTGPAAYDTWITALEGDSADPFGTAYNAQVWLECRIFATRFLKEAKERLKECDGALFDQAIGPYEKVAENLRKVAEEFPFLDTPMEQKEKNMRDKEKIQRTVGYLKTAREAEEQGLKALVQIVESM
jgi:hypothetical protein